MLCGCLDTLYLVNRPLLGAFTFNAGAVMADFHERFRAELDKPGFRQARLLRRLAVDVVTSAERAKKSRETAEHYRERFKDDEMYKRFSIFAAEEDKATAWLKALIARVEAEGLPPEVLAYDPTRPQGDPR